MLCRKYICQPCNYSILCNGIGQLTCSFCSTHAGCTCCSCLLLMPACRLVVLLLQVCLCVPMKQVTVTMGHPLMAGA